MCPLCIGTVTLLASSGTSAGGLAALLLRLRKRARGRQPSPRRASRPQHALHRGMLRTQPDP